MDIYSAIFSEWDLYNVIILRGIDQLLHQAALTVNLSYYSTCNIYSLKIWGFFQSRKKKSGNIRSGNPRLRDSRSRKIHTHISAYLNTLSRYLAGP